MIAFLDRQVCPKIGFLAEDNASEDIPCRFPERCLDILTHWFEKGRSRGILFPNKFTGNYLTVSALEQVMRRAVSDAELPKNATPHCLRHSFATHLMEQGVERQNIQALQNF
ncbi:MULTISPECIES: tyrosine-type recombinase/integrase [Eisenbergiella]|uniref:tyrosine-type recombinase/integrase n=1 Tax=Eisenbergiella massiliensis TaxID=1720294 RepID=UPI002ED3EE98